MTTLTKKGKNENSRVLPTLRNDFLTNRFFTPRLFDFDDDFFRSEVATPPVNIIETSKEFKLDLSVPGMKKEDFKIDVDNGVLTISSEKETDKNEGNENYCRHEFSYNSFSRNFTLPDNVAENNINAKYTDGMLQIIIPKTEATVSKPKKQITVA